MLIALSGVSGVGKSYFSNLFSHQLNIKKVNTIRTRAIRTNENPESSGLFLSNDQLDSLKKEDKIAYDFSVFGNRYGYLKNEIFSSDNYIFEMHYTTIDDWKKLVPSIKTIYIFPTDLNISKKHLKERNLSKLKESERISEITEQYNFMKNNKNFQNKFDYILYNDYTENFKNELTLLIEKILGENK